MDGFRSPDTGGMPIETCVEGYMSGLDMNRHAAQFNTGQEALRGFYPERFRGLGLRV